MSDDLRVDGAGGASAGADGRLTDPGFLVDADPAEVLGLADVASGPAGRLAAAVYRASAYLHRDAGAGVRRQLLALDAARYGDRELSARITAVPVDGEAEARWEVMWATGNMVDPRCRSFPAGHNTVTAVATGVLEGLAVAVTGSDDRTLRVWDLTTGRQAGAELVFPAKVGAVAVAPDGRLVVAFGCELAVLAPL